MVLDEASQTIIEVASSLVHSEQKTRLLIEVLRRLSPLNIAQSAVFSPYSSVEIGIAISSKDFEDKILWLM